MKPSPTRQSTMSQQPDPRAGRPPEQQTPGQQTLEQQAPEQNALEQQARALLDADLARQPAELREALAQRRQQALRAARQTDKRPQRHRQRQRQWQRPLAGFAVAAALAVGIGLNLPSGGNAPGGQPTARLPTAAAAADVDMLDSLDFMLWLAQQKETG